MGKKITDVPVIEKVLVRSEKGKAGQKDEGGLERVLGHPGLGAAAIGMR